MSKSIVIIGGGFAGAYLARGLERSLPAEWELVLFSEENFLTFTPLLAEVVGSSIGPQHVVRPVRQFLRRTLCRTAAVTGLRLEARAVEYRLADGRTATQAYEHLVLACGMVVNTDIMPGVAAHAFPLKTMGDALALRNHVLTQLERAEVETDPERRRHILSFAVIGGGFSGVEVAGQIHDLLIASRKFYPSLRSEPPHVVILHGPKRLLTELPESLGDYARRRLEARGLTVRLETHAHAVTREGVRLDDGSTVAASTVVCTIGNMVTPLMAASGLPLEHGRLRTEPDMRVPGHANVWALGDCALVPNAKDGKQSPTLAQFALRQANQLAANLNRAIAGQPTRPFSFRMLGSFAAIGHHNAVGQVLGLKVSGFFAWMMWRGIYLGKTPTLARKIQVAFDWLWDMFFPRDLVQLNPRTTRRVPRAHYEPGEYVFREGDEAEEFYIIERGTAGVYVKGSAEPVAVLGPGDHFGAAAILHPTSEPVSVRAEEPLDVLAMGRERFQDLADHLRRLRTDLDGRMERVLGAWKLLDEEFRHDHAGQPACWCDDASDGARRPMPFSAAMTFAGNMCHHPTPASGTPRGLCGGGRAGKVARGLHRGRPQRRAVCTRLKPPSHASIAEIIVAASALTSWPEVEIVGGSDTALPVIAGPAVHRRRQQQYDRQLVSL